MDLQTEMRPKLKQDSIFLKTRDGVFLQSDTATFLLKGKSMYQLLTTLSQYMNGEHTLGDICEAFAPSQQEIVVKLVNTLLQRGVLKNHLQESPDLLSEAVRKHFNAQLELLDHYIDLPLAHFKTFRESQLLLRGSGEAFTALATSLLQNGLQHLYLLPDDQPDAYQEHLKTTIDALQQAGIDSSLSCPASADVSTYDLVVYCADDSSLKDIAEIQQACFRAQKPFLPATVFGKQALIGPLVQPGSNGPCWICAQMRVSANAKSEETAAIWRALALGSDLSTWNTPLFTPQARNLGNGVGFELFKFLTNCLPSEALNGLIFHNLETLESYHSNLIPHPLCPVCSSVSEENTSQHLSEVIAGQRDVEVELGDALLRHLQVLINPLAGIFHQFADDTITQLPLKASHLIVGSPASPLTPGFEVTAYNTNTLLEARLTTMTEAVGRYTRSLPDSRTMTTASWNEIQQSGKKALTPQQLTLWSGANAFEEEKRINWYPTRSLLTQEMYFVPAAVVYPSSKLNQRGLFEKTGAGAAADTNFQSLLSAGLTSALAYEQIRELTRGRSTVKRVEKAAFEDSDADLTFLLHNAQHFQRPFELLEVLHPSPLHVVLACTTDLEEQAISVFGWGLSREIAVSNALLRLVGGLQFLKYEGKLPELTAGALCPEFSMQSDVLFARKTSDHPQKPATTLPALQEYLRAAGRDLLFAHTTTADIWETKLFISGVVLLTQATP